MPTQVHEPLRSTHRRSPTGTALTPLTHLAEVVESVAARTWLLVPSLAGYLPFFVIYFATRLPFSLPSAAAACGGQPILDQRWGYTIADVAGYLRACGAAGREAVLRQQNADLLYPAVFGLMLTVSFALLLRFVARPGSALHLLVLLPAVTTGADYLENIGLRTVLALYPEQPAFLPALALVTATKLTTGWLCTVALLGVLGAAGVRWAVHRARTRRGHPTGR